MRNASMKYSQALKIQARDAVWWKDACLLYFPKFSGMPIPYEIERPIHELKDLQKVHLPHQQLRMSHQRTAE